MDSRQDQRMRWQGGMYHSALVRQRLIVARKDGKNGA